MNRNTVMSALAVVLLGFFLGTNGLHGQATTDNSSKVQSSNQSVLSTDSPRTKEIKAAIVRLMNAAKNGEIEFLDEIYHEDMKIYMISGSNEVSEMDKPMFIAHIKEAVKMGAGQNTWANFHKIEANENTGHVLISRKVNLTGTEKLITLSIDFVKANDRWQIIRETIFTGSDVAPVKDPAVVAIKNTPAQLETFNEQFNEIVSKYDADTFVELYEPNSWLIAPTQQPSKGPEDLRKMISFLSKNKYRMFHSIDRVLVSNDGSQAILIGEAKATNDDTPAKAVGTYLFVLRQVDGQWKIAIDMYNQYDAK